MRVSSKTLSLLAVKHGSGCTAWNSVDWQTQWSLKSDTVWITPWIVKVLEQSYFLSRWTAAVGQYQAFTGSYILRASERKTDKHTSNGWKEETFLRDSGKYSIYIISFLVKVIFTSPEPAFSAVLSAYYSFSYSIASLFPERAACCNLHSQESDDLFNAWISKTTCSMIKGTFGAVCFLFLWLSSSQFIFRVEHFQAWRCVRWEVSAGTCLSYFP